MLDDRDVFAPGDRVRDRYRIARLIGKGGMGEIYEVVDEQSGESLALKTVLRRLAGNPKVIARFERETWCSQRIAHPNVLQIYDVFEHVPPGSSAETRPIPCMLMELLRGETVADRLVRQETFGQDEARPVVCQAAAALAAAHRRRIVHRDLKPDNIFLVPGAEPRAAGDGAASTGGAPVRVVVTDFGVARVERRHDERITESNVLLGTPAYMAPEQLELEHAIPASDLYTLGLVTYEMLTGRQPFQADSPLQMVFKRVTEEPIPPETYLAGELEPAWREVLDRCLARHPEDRFASAAEIIEVLEGRAAVRRYRRGEAQASPPPAAGRRGRRTPRLAVVLAVLAGFVAVAAIAWWFLG